MSRFKKELWKAKDVLCPFFMDDSVEERSIRCEGFALGTETVSRFRSLDLRERHMGCYCASKYENCPVFRCTYGEKYSG